MKGIVAGFRRHGVLALAVLALAVLGAAHWKYRKAHNRAVAEAYESGVSQGLVYARTTLDPIAEAPLLIFDHLGIAWADLVPNLTQVYGLERVAAKQWTVPAVFGTFPVNGEAPPSGEVRTTADALTFSQPGEYYLRTTVGDFKILILDKQANRDGHAMAIAAFVARNIVPSMADARKIQPNYSYYDYQRPDKALKRFFATDQPVGFQCGYATEFLNFVLVRRGFQVRRMWLHTEQGGAHFVSQVFLPDSGRWAAIDAMYGALLTNRQGEPLSVEEVAKLLRERPEEVAVKDIARKRWLKYPYGNFMHEFTWTPALLDAPCVKPAEYCAMIRDCTVRYWCIEYDDVFRWRIASKSSWDGKSLVQ